MVLLIFIFVLVLPSSSYLESINVASFTSAEACFDSKLQTPTQNCTAQALSVLSSLNTALLEIKSNTIIPTKKLIPGIATGLLNLFASNADTSGNFDAENARLSASNPWCSGSINIELFFQIGSSLPVEFHTLEKRRLYL